MKVLDWKGISDQIEPMSVKVAAEMSLKYGVAFKGRAEEIKPKSINQWDFPRII